MNFRLSKIIDQEVKKTTYVPNRVRPSHRRISGVKTFRTVTRNVPSHTLNEENLELDVLDLAKIGQEIKEKETEKKLDKFFRSTV